MGAGGGGRKFRLSLKRSRERELSKLNKCEQVGRKKGV